LLLIYSSNILEMQGLMLGQIDFIFEQLFIAQLWLLDTDVWGTVPIMNTR